LKDGQNVISWPWDQISQKKIWSRGLQLHDI
jgi:hypothetical protein